MKKTLLFAAAFAMMATAAMAQENLIVNGDMTDFSSGDQDQTIPDEWTSAGNVWNNRTSVQQFNDTDWDELDPNNVIGDLENYAKVALYDWNSWMNGTLSQVVETTTATDYEFSYIYRPVVQSVRASADGVNPVRLWVCLYELTSTGALPENAEPFWNKEITWQEGDEWINGNWEAVKENVAIDGMNIDYVMVQIGVYGQSGDDSQGGNGTNNVSMNASGFSLVAGGAGVESIESNAKAVSTRYYGIDGVEILNPAEGTFVIEKSVLDNGKVKTSKKVF